MAVTAFWFGLAFENVFKGLIDFPSGTINISLHTSSWTPAQDTDNDWADVDNEVVGAGYTHEGETLASKSITYTAGTNVLKLDAADVTWAAASITARYAIVYVREVADADSVLLFYVDFGEDVTSVAGDFKVEWNADGMAKVTVS